MAKQALRRIPAVLLRCRNVIGPTRRHLVRFVLDASSLCAAILTRYILLGRRLT